MIDEPAPEVDLSYTWTGETPPSTPIFYHWEVTDSAGNRVSTPEMLVYYDDIRFEWQTLEDEHMAVWWHDRDAAFGQRVFDIAQTAFAEQQMLFQAELDYQIRIIIYNSFAEFSAWQGFVSELLGGASVPQFRHYRSNCRGL